MIGMSIYSLPYMYNHCNPQVRHRSKISVLQSNAIGAVGYGECCLQELQSLMPPFEVTLNHTHNNVCAQVCTFMHMYTL